MGCQRLVSNHIPWLCLVPGITQGSRVRGVPYFSCYTLGWDRARVRLQHRNVPAPIKLGGSDPVPPGGTPGNSVPGGGYLGAGVCCWGSKNTKDEKEEKDSEEEEGSVLDYPYLSCHCRVPGCLPWTFTCLSGGHWEIPQLSLTPTSPDFSCRWGFSQVLRKAHAIQLEM